MKFENIVKALSKISNSVNIRTSNDKVKFIASNANEQLVISLNSNIVINTDVFDIRTLKSVSSLMELSKLTQNNTDEIVITDNNQYSSFVLPSCIVKAIIDNISYLPIEKYNGRNKNFLNTVLFNVNGCYISNGHAICEINGFSYHDFVKNLEKPNVIVPKNFFNIAKDLQIGKRDGIVIHYAQNGAVKIRDVLEDKKDIIGTVKYTSKNTGIEYPNITDVLPHKNDNFKIVLNPDAVINEITNETENIEIINNEIIFLKGGMFGNPKTELNRITVGYNGISADIMFNADYVKRICKALKKFSDVINLDCYMSFNRIKGGVFSIYDKKTDISIKTVLCRVIM